jgi:hypothetical protein
MKSVRYPSLYQINTRVWLTALSRRQGRPVTLDDVPDVELDRLAKQGFDWIWLLSVWQTGPASRAVSHSIPELRRTFEATLPDLREEDIAGSGFAIASYQVHQNLGGDGALARLRKRLRERGMKVMLDFVPNHTALDHHWVEDHPEYYISGTERDLAQAPHDYIRIERHGDDLVLAHGRDPYFPGWTDTLQLNYANPATQYAMRRELLRIAGQCDGVRCDMAMLVLPEVFDRTWGLRAPPFWQETIRRLRERAEDFCLMAEVYWDLEWTLQQQGFDYTYDKRLYDRLRDGLARPVREHFRADLDYQDHLVRFLENHDEPRAATMFSPEAHRAAAVLAYLSPGMRFFHQGQLEGKRKHIPPQLGRGPDEPVDPKLNLFYHDLLALLRRPVVRRGRWRLLECIPAWEGNWTFDCLIAFGWEDSGGERLLVLVNQAPNRSQCFVRLPFDDLGNMWWRLDNLLGPAVYDRDGKDLLSRGLYLDMAPWQADVFSLKPVFRRDPGATEPTWP